MKRDCEPCMELGHPLELPGERSLSLSHSQQVSIFCHPSTNKCSSRPQCTSHPLSQPVSHDSFVVEHLHRYFGGLQDILLQEEKSLYNPIDYIGIYI